MSQPKSPSRVQENEIFLEVANILDKERTLYQMKIHQEKQQASEWKEKYNKLRSIWMKEASQCPESLTQANLLQALADLEVNHEWDDEIFEVYDSDNEEDVENRDLFEHKNFQDREAQEVSISSFTVDDDWRTSLEDPNGLLLQPDDFSSLVLTKSMGQFLDLSSLNLSQKLFMIIIRKIFPSRLPLLGDEQTNLFVPPQDYPLNTFIRALSLTHTTLQPSFTPPLCYCLRAPQLVAVDLCSTNLSEESFERIMEVLRGRKTTPAYLLLNNNLELAYGLQNPLVLNKRVAEKKKDEKKANPSEKSDSTLFTSHHILHVLSSSTWGLGVSFADYHQAPRILADQAIDSMSKKNSMASNLAYKEVLKPPMRAKAFLELLIQILKGEINTFVTKNLAPSKSSALNRTKSISNKKSGVGKCGSIPIRMIDPIKDIKVLSITDCTLSLASINLFPSLLTLLQSTLTDLDLSFCSICNYGLRKLSHFIKNSEILIRLELKGNEIDDYGVFSLCQDLIINKSLIHVGLGSNSISGISTILLLKILIKKLNISIIDMRGNNGIHHYIIQNVNNYLEDISSLGNFIWDSSDLVTNTSFKYLPSAVSNDIELESLLRHDQKLFFQPLIKKSIIKVSKTKIFSTLCASISTSKILSQPNFIKSIDSNYTIYPEKVQIDGLTIRWFIRPIPLSTLSTASAEWMHLYNNYISTFENNKAKESFQFRDGFFSVPSKIKLMWEIRILVSNKILSKYRYDVTSSFENRHPFFLSQNDNIFNINGTEFNDYENIYENEQNNGLQSIFESFPDEFSKGSSFSVSKEEAISYLSSSLPWISCSVIIPFIPSINSTIQIRLIAISNVFAINEENIGLYDEDLYINQSNYIEEFLGVETKLLTITPFFKTDSYYLGGDDDHNVDQSLNKQPLYTDLENNNKYNQYIQIMNSISSPYLELFNHDFQSIYFQRDFSPIPLIQFLKLKNWKHQFNFQDKLMSFIDFNEAPIPITVSNFFFNQKVLRCFVWTKGSKGKLKWQSKITLKNEINKSFDINIEKNKNEFNPKYEWSVIRVSKDLLYPPVVLKIGDHNTSTNNNSYNSNSSVLDIWKFKEFEVILEDLCPSDLIFVTYRIINHNECSISDSNFDLAFRHFEVRIIPDSTIFTTLKETNELISGIVFHPLNVYTITN